MNFYRQMADVQSGDKHSIWSITLQLSGQQKLSPDYEGAPCVWLQNQIYYDKSQLIRDWVTNVIKE